MRAIMLDQAQEDFAEIVDFLESRESGLGDKFHRQVLRGIDRIETFPRMYAKYSKNFRVCPLGKFKYGMFYRVRRMFIFIHAILDLRRNPRLIRGRLK